MRIGGIPDPQEEQQMKRKRLAKLALGATCVAALAVPVSGQAGSLGSKDGGGRAFYAGVQARF